MKMMFVGTYGSESPTHAVLPFLQAQGATDEGHDAEVFVVGDAAVLMRDSVAKATVPVGWPPVYEVMVKLIEQKVPIYV